MKALHAQVTEDEQHNARLRAAELGMSIADYLRKLVKADIEHQWLTKHGPRALANVEGGNDISIQPGGPT